MIFRRRHQFVALMLTALWPAAMMLAVCHVGHDHGASSPEASAAHEHHGHAHDGHGDHHDGDEPDHEHPQRHHSDDCESCRLLSLPTLAVAATAPPAPAGLVECPVEAVPPAPHVAPETVVSLRGPPVS